MKDRFPKKYDPSFEQALYHEREEAGYFTPERVAQHTGRKPTGKFIISIPPPNVTGVLHIGHALTLAIEDTMVRYNRMQGKETLWVPGTDHAGIATQIVVERQLQQQEKKSKEDLWRTGFLQRVRKWVDYSRTTMMSQTKRMGASADRTREQFTMSEKLSRSVRKAFKTLFEQGKIYQDTYMVNRSPDAKTVLSDLEVEFVQEEGKMYYIRYFVEGKGDNITIATVRPETIFADVAIAVHPKDRRYKKWIGKNVLIPIVNRTIPVIADDRVAIDFGTGALKITPTHSQTDREIARDHKLPMDRFAFDRNNKFTHWAGDELVGLNIYDYLENMLHQLGEIGNLVETKPHVSSVPYCTRTGCRVQPMLSQQRFMDVQEAADRIKVRFEKQEVQVYPERFINTFEQRLGEIKPRCISRQLWWGHRIPIRYEEWEKGVIVRHAFDEENVLNMKSGSNSVLSLMIFNLIADNRLPNPFNIEQLLELLMQTSLTAHEGKIREVYTTLYKKKFKDAKAKQEEIKQIQAIFGSLEKAKSDAIVELGGKIVDLLDKSANIDIQGDKYLFEYYSKGEKIMVRQEEDVLDTWFSSGLWPFSILWRPEETPDLKKFYPNTVMETWYDIIFFRVIRMMLMGEMLMDEMPFEHVYLHGLVKDDQGKKMSKSKGNVMDPLKLIDQYGADALRGALLLGNTPGNDQKFQEQKVEYVARFLNKLWNASRFVAMRAAGDGDKQIELHYEKIGREIEKNKAQLNDYDIWMIGKLTDLISQAEKYMAKFMLGESLQESVDTVWHEFCDWYIEIAKVKNSPVTDQVMLYALGTFYKVLHPSLPFVTEKLWELVGFTWPLMISEWPLPLAIGDKNYRINMLMEMIAHRRQLKTQVTDKPHEKISIFVQGNKDIQLLVEQHYDLVRDIIKVENISYYEEHQEIEDGWQIAMLMDIKLGAKGIKSVDRRITLADLEKQVAEEEQFLQRMRGMFTGDFAARAPEGVIKEKKKKMEEVKSRIAAMQYEINKIKMERK